LESGIGKLWGLEVDRALEITYKEVRKALLSERKKEGGNLVKPGWGLKDSRYWVAKYWGSLQHS